MKIISVKTASKRYPIFLGRGAWKKATEELKNRPERIAVITSKTVGNKLRDSIAPLLKGLPKSAGLLALPDGEKSKTPKTLNSIYTWLLRNQYDRKTIVVALGGGVIGDMAGYAAATFMRGVPFVQIPTTLLSMVDASIGGKVAVNHPLGKNMIGSFYQPEAVFMDTRALETLPREEFENGMAEVIKHGVIRDARYFSFLEKNLNSILDKNETTLTSAIEGSCRIKAEVVQRDEREEGLRAILNYGHTFAHALETVTKYSYFKHGQAVIYGMVAAGSLGNQIGGFSQADLKRQNDLLNRLRKKKLPKLNIKDLNKAMARDKKTSLGKLTFIVPQEIGCVNIVKDVSSKAITAAWNSIIKKP